MDHSSEFLHRFHHVPPSRLLTDDNVMEKTHFRLQSATTPSIINTTNSAVNSGARPLLMPSANTVHAAVATGAGHSPGSRGSIPKYFPENFKDFFSMLAEDEDHNEVITNLLEDKVIPRTTSTPKRGDSKKHSTNLHPHQHQQHPDRTCEKPFCCHNGNAGSGGIHLDSPLYSSGGGLTRTLSSKYYRRRPSQHRLLPNADASANLLDSAVGSSSPSTGSSLTSLTNQVSNFGRSNSFRFNRPTPSAAATYSSYLSYQPVALVDRSSPNSTCKHIQYCCLHQVQGSSTTRGHPQSSFQLGSNASVTTSTLSLNTEQQRTTATTAGSGRLLPLSPGAPSRTAFGLPHAAAPDGINFSDDEKKGLIYPQLTADRYPRAIDTLDHRDNRQWADGLEGAGGSGSLEQQRTRYSLLAKSYDQINRSRIFGECVWD